MIEKGTRNTPTKSQTALQVLSLTLLTPSRKAQRLPLKSLSDMA